MFIRDVELPTGELWYAMADGPDDPCLCIPTGGIDGMSAEEIGQNVLDHMHYARLAAAENYASWASMGSWEQFITPERRQLMEEFEGWSPKIDRALQILRGTHVQPKEPPAPRKKYPGYVYLLKAGSYYKIGRASDISRRLAQFGVQLPFPFECLHTVACSDMIKAEQYLHAKFASKRGNGEWFNLDDNDVRWICSVTQLEPEGQ